MTCDLKLTDLRYLVHLGVSAEERRAPQPISISVCIHFSERPSSMMSDDIADTLCYHSLTNRIKASLLKQHTFNLIEYVGACVYACVYEELFQARIESAPFEVAIHKMAPPIAELQGGATFTYRGVFERGVADDVHKHWF